MKTLIGIVWSACVVLAGSAAADEPQGAAAPAQEGSIELGLAVAADFTPVYPTHNIPHGHAVCAAFRIPPSDTSRRITCRWLPAGETSSDHPGRFAHYTMTLAAGTDRGYFRHAPVVPLSPGPYRAEILIDNQPWKSVEFQVVPALKGIQLQKPEDLLAIVPGTVWTYDLTVQAAPGAQVALPGVSLGPDGTFKTPCTVTAAGTDPEGSHLVLRIGGQVAAEKWIRVTHGGVFLTKESLGGTVHVLNPQEKVLPWPLRPPAHWVFSPRDGSEQVPLNVFGPVPLQGPEGEAPGYILFTEPKPRAFGRHVAPPGSIIRTEESHVLPGVGLVRRTIIEARNDHLLTRYDYALANVKTPPTPALSAASGAQ